MYQYCYGSSFNKNLLVVLASFFHLADDGDGDDDYEGYYSTVYTYYLQVCKAGIEKTILSVNESKHVLL